MNPLEALWDSINRILDLLPPELRQWARDLFGNPLVQGFLGLGLLLLLLGAGGVLRLAIPGLGLIAGAGFGLLLQGLVKVAEAIRSGSAAALDEATRLFAEATTKLKGSVSLDGLKRSLEETKGRLESLPGVGKYVQLVETLGPSGVGQRIFQGDLANLNAFADKIAALGSTTRDALGQALQQFPAARERILEAGPEAIDVLGKFVTTPLISPETQLQIFQEIESRGKDVITDLNSLLKTIQPTEVQQLIRIPNVSVTQLNNLSWRSTDGLDLLRAELNGAHSIERHGSQLSNLEMEQRVLGTNPNLPQSRSALKFVNDTVHRDAVNQAYRNFEAEIKSHFLTGGNYREWTYDYGAPTGTGFTNTGTRRNPIVQPINIGDTTKVTISFGIDPTSSAGFRLVSAFPTYP